MHARIVPQPIRHHRHTSRAVGRSVIAAAALAMLSLGCGDTESGDPAQAAPPTDATAGTGEQAAGLVRVSPTDAAAVIDDPPPGLVVLDVRTPEEFAEGHLDGAILVDFYRDDFPEQLAALDPEVPYVLYCRSGNRSGQALAMMDELGFDSVLDIDGGVLAWQAAGLPLTSG